MEKGPAGGEGVERDRFRYKKRFPRTDVILK